MEAVTLAQTNEVVLSDISRDILEFGQFKNVIMLVRERNEVIYKNFAQEVFSRSRTVISSIGIDPKCTNFFNRCSVDQSTLLLIEVPQIRQLTVSPLDMFEKVKDYPNIFPLTPLFSISDDSNALGEEYGVRKFFEGGSEEYGQKLLQEKIPFIRVRDALESIGLLRKYLKLRTHFE